jgi:hypothetical protein
MQKSKIYVGIDPGVMTGIAVIIDGQYVSIGQCSIIKAMKAVEKLLEHTDVDICLHVENPSFRKWFGQTGREKLQGAGSIKRDYKIWTEFAEFHKLRMFPIAPAAVGSQFNDEKIFQSATGWKARTGKHARDAAKIIFAFKK